MPILELSFPPVIKQNISQNARKSKYNCGDYKNARSFSVLKCSFYFIVRFSAQKIFGYALWCAEMFF